MMRALVLCLVTALVFAGFDAHAAEPSDEAYESRNPDLLSADALRSEISHLEWSLRQQGLAPPVVLLSVGGGVAIGGGLFWLIFAGASTREEDGGSCTEDCDTLEGVRFAFGAAAIGGIAAAIGGAVFLIQRIAQRNPQKKRLLSLKRELRRREISVDFDVAPTPNGGARFALKFEF